MICLWNKLQKSKYFKVSNNAIYYSSCWSAVLLNALQDFNDIWQPLQSGPLLGRPQKKHLEVLRKHCKRCHDWKKKKCRIRLCRHSTLFLLQHTNPSLYTTNSTSLHYTFWHPFRYINICQTHTRTHTPHHSVSLHTHGWDKIQANPPRFIIIKTRRGNNLML